MCQNNTPHAFSVSVKVEGVEAQDDKAIEKVVAILPPRKTIELYHLSSRKQAAEPYEIIAELAVEETRQPPVSAQLARTSTMDSGVPQSAASTRTSTPASGAKDRAYILQLRQRIVPKGLKNILEVSLSSSPPEALYPEQRWSSGVKIFPPFLSW